MDDDDDDDSVKGFNYFCHQILNYKDFRFFVIYGMVVKLKINSGQVQNTGVSSGGSNQPVVNNPMVRDNNQKYVNPAGTILNESGIPSTYGGFEGVVYDMDNYHLAQGIKKAGWGYLLNILENCISTGKVSEVVDICLTSINSKGDKILTAMRFDLRTLPVSHGLHPDNHSPIFSLINGTNARNISKHQIHIEGSLEEFIAHI